MATKNKIYKYYTSCSYIDVKTDIQHTVTTNLFKVGIYIIFDNNPKYQGNTTPQLMQKFIKRLQRDVQSNKIKDLILGREINVTKDDNGYLVEV